MNQREFGGGSETGKIAGQESLQKANLKGGLIKWGGQSSAAWRGQRLKPSNTADSSLREFSLLIQQESSNNKVFLS